MEQFYCFQVTDEGTIKHHDSQPLTSGDIKYYSSDKAVSSVSEMKTVLEFLTVDEKRNICILEGYHRIYVLEGHRLRPFIFANGKVKVAEIVDRAEQECAYYREPVTRLYGFRAEITLEEVPLQIIPGIQVDNTLIICKNCETGRFFPISQIYSNAYAVIGKCIAVSKGNIITISKKPACMVLVFREGRLLREIWKKKLLGGRKAVAGRIIFHVLMFLKHRKLWIVSDRISKADDNGEAFFRYAMEHPPANTKIIFAISKDSADYPKMKKIGSCVSALSFRHKLLHLLCDINISSQADVITINPFAGHDEALRDLLWHQKQVFLQHGTIMADLSPWLNRYNLNFSGFVTSARPEYESIVNGAYRYPQDHVWITGLPRFDRLYNDKSRYVTIMPTWRKYLMGFCDDRTGQWTLRPGFKDSDYYRFFNELLNSELLLQAIQTYGYTLQFIPHPTLLPHIDLFDHDPRVVFLHAAPSYREVYAKSNLVVTDYSSGVFDFAYLHKPVIYCHFDKEEFYSGEHIYSSGYFDYERDGFGDITYDLEQTIDRIVDLVSRGCPMDAKYQKRVDDFFAFRDQNNCERVMQRILALQEQNV